MESLSGDEESTSTFWNMPQREGTLISDMTRCRPRSAISPRRRDSCWLSIPYETRAGVTGTMLLKGERMRPPDLSLSLDTSGWHGIYLGLFGEGTKGDFALRVKLSDEEHFDTVRPTVTSLVEGKWVGNKPLPGSESGIEEFFWKAADLGGQELVVSYPGYEKPTTAQIAFVRLVPMTDEEVSDYRDASGGLETRVLAAEMDGQGPFHQGGQSVEDLLEFLSPLRDTDVGKLFLGTGGIGAGSMFYPTTVGEMYGAGEEAFFDDAGCRAVESLRGYVAHGIDPVKARVDYAHSLGLEVYLGFRMGTMDVIPPSWCEPVPFWREHPEWRCRDREGNTTTRLSMAYPEVRRFYIDLFLELAKYGVKGVQCIYTRRAPFVLFEPPVVESFKNEYGVDPRDLPDVPHAFTGDERLQKHWEGYVTQFMRELRDALDGLEPRTGDRVEVVANVMHDPRSNRGAGLDLETWAMEGLVDILAPYTGGDGSTMVDYDYFKKVTLGTSCVFYEDVTPRQMPGRDYCEHAGRAYEGGAAGLAFWDNSGRIMTKSQWNTVRRLGHREALGRMFLEPDSYRMHPLRLFDGFIPEVRFM